MKEILNQIKMSIYKLNRNDIVNEVIIENIQKSTETFTDLYFFQEEIIYNITNELNKLKRMFYR